MLIATWNVNSIRAHERGVVEWTEEHRPDVVALQETMCDERSFPRAGFAGLGYEAAVVGRGGHNGVALLSRVGLDDVWGTPEGAVAPFDEPRVVSARCGGVRILNAYAPNGRRVGTIEHARKLAWCSYVSSLIEEELGDGDLAFLGDLNIAPTDLDVWDPHRYRSRNLTSPAERRAFAAWCELGLIDVVRRDAPPGVPLFSWWNRRGDFFESDRGWRLDHVLMSQGLASRSSLVGIDREARHRAGTDHAPLVVRVG